MRISVIIPALDEELNIQRAIASAWNARCDEVIVVDGGSVDRTREVAQAEQCQFLETPAGRAIQQNAGATIATGDMLLFLHADNWLSDSACDQIRSALAGNPATVCGAFRQRIQTDRFVFRWIEFGNAVRARWLGLPYGDQAIFVCRETFFNVGGFPTVPLLEDLLLMKKLRKVSRPMLLPGPVFIGTRHWEKRGVVRQTLRNWRLLISYAAGATPEQGAEY